MEKDRSEDFILDEISEYYKNEPLPEDASENGDAEAERESTETAAGDEPEHGKLHGENENENETEAAAKVKASLGMFRIISAAIAFSVLLSVFLVGVLSYKDEEDINFRYAHIRTNSKKYAEALKKINQINDEITALEDDALEKQTELNTITEYESNTGTIKSKQSSLKEELDEKKASAESKEKKLSELDKSLKSKIPTMITLNPGIYTVGENIFAGSYKAVGNGSFTLSSSTGGAKLNTTLSSDEKAITLENGDIIKLETKAVFSRTNQE